MSLVMAWQRGAVVAAIIACCSSARADGGLPANPDAGWLADDKGCKVVNAHPKPDETVIWNGACVDGWADGEGVVQWFSKGQSGQHYSGSVKRGIYDGQGSLRMVDASEYTGHFVHGLLQGFAKAQWPNGNRYEGDFLDGERTGHATILWADGGTYTGDVVKGRPDGHGIKRQANGIVVESEFAAGRNIGRGLMRTADGQTKEIMAPPRELVDDPEKVGVVSAEAVCATMPAPDVSSVANWSGEAAFDSRFIVQGGRVVAIDIKGLRSAGSRATDRALIASIQRTLTDGYRCQGNHVVAQQFFLKSPNPPTSLDAQPESALPATAPSASQTVWSAGYASRIHEAIRAHIVWNEDTPGSPVAEMEVRTSPDGSIVQAKMLKSSGVASWDLAVQSALAQVGRIPLDLNGQVPPTLLLRFRPREAVNGGQ